MISRSEQAIAAKRFVKRWKDRGRERSDSQTFWLTLLREVYGVENVDEYIHFEDRVQTGFLDGIIESTRVLIEQKSKDINLRRKIRQSDGTTLTPYEQAKQYANNLPFSKIPRWIIISNFTEFHIYDMERPGSEPEVILLVDLPSEFNRMNFLVDPEDDYVQKAMEVSLQAGELVGMLYDALLQQYDDPEDPDTLHDLNVLCVRLVFCLYAEDAELFGRHRMFHDYLAKHSAVSYRTALRDLFIVLDQKPEERDIFINKDLAAFPYINGGLFEKETVSIPQLNEEIIDILLNRMSSGFDWSSISPTIFGAVFESTLNPESRRSGGMHYTSLENIHKVIDPLFLNDLNDELISIKNARQLGPRNNKLKEFQNKLASLIFLDPAAGSGNFLTETYLSLRRLENEAIKMQGDQIAFDKSIIKVSINQFYGIEINDFAVSVARTALWIAESQMMKETADILNIELEYFPLESYANIVEGNALRLDWNDVAPMNRLNYIMGNPPFIGHQWRNSEQVEDMIYAFPELKNHGKLDYVCAWYSKAADYMQDTRIATAYVSTSSITQGESVPILWRYLIERKNVEIQFAHQPFVWSSEASSQAGVHCVIVGFICYSTNDSKYLFDKGSAKKVDYINGYLVDANDIYIRSRGNPLTKGLPAMTKGSQPTDGLGLVFEPEEYRSFVNQYPNDHDLLKRYMGSYEFINNKERYCLWLNDVPLSRYSSNPIIVDRLSAVREFRLTSETESVREYAKYPYLFTQIRQPESDYLAFPAMSSSSRKYIPIGFINKEVIASNQLYIIPNASLLLFGILTSYMHMVWTKVICGRLRHDYRYAPAIYNNFPFPDLSSTDKSSIERTAKAILETRNLYHDLTLADMYRDLTMPQKLRQAHEENDRAVMKAYGYKRRTITESELLAKLMNMHQKLVGEEN